MESSEPVLIVKNLTTKLRIDNCDYPVVEDLSFNLYKGKTLAIVGESGCGKTFSALSVLQILPTPPSLKSEGEIVYQGQNLLNLSEKEMRRLRGGKIAMIFQDPISALNPVYRIGDQLIEAAELHLDLYGNEAFERAVKALKEVGISSPEKRMYDYPHQLSGGMKQRVMIAMALMCEPDILIADEPTTALDVTIQAQVLDLIRELQKRRNMAVLLITHDMGVVAEVADEVIVMYASKAVEKGTVNQIFDEMAHPYTLGLFRSRAGQKKGRGLLEAIKGSVPPLTQYPQGCRFHPRCPFAMKKCEQGKVPHFNIPGNVGHQAACLLWDETSESAIKRKEFESHERTFT